jgi:hypothetical protein
MATLRNPLDGGLLTVRFTVPGQWYSPPKPSDDWHFANCRLPTMTLGALGPVTSFADVLEHANADNMPALQASAVAAVKNLRFFINPPLKDLYL